VPQALNLPEVGEGIASGTVVAVLVKVGDRIEVDQAILELETDKAVVEVPSPMAGVVTEVHVKPNSEARIGAPMITIEASAGAPEAATTPAATPSPAAPAAAPAAPAAPAAAPPVAAAPEPALPGLIPAAPSVRRLARQLGVSLAAVAGSGPLGRISAHDVERFARGEGGAAGAVGVAPMPLPDFSRWGETERVAMSGIRKATVRAMTQAWATVPMVTHFDEADATHFEALRQRYKKLVERAGAKLTPTAILLKVVAGALRRFPDFNASIDVETQEIVYKKYVSIATAVDTEHGLLVPVIRDVDQKSVVELAVELGAIAEKARQRKLTPDDMSGGNFIISNLGGIGGTGFTPIVTPPDVAILGVARSSMKPVWNAEQEAFEPRLMMPLSLSYDHRLIDGASAARFVRWICEAVEEPFLLSLEG
jgi:pyruvate dehydrogenase E2 component (dihydrolipoamide acetyltransferase)